MRRDPDPALCTAAPPWPAPHPFGNERLWLDCLLEREILRLRARYELSLDELRGLYISDRQVDDLLHRHAEQFGAQTGGNAADTRDPVAMLSAQAAQWREHFAADSPLALLAERFGLSEGDLELVFVILAPELDLRYETLYAYLNNDIGRKTATLDMAQRLLDAEPRLPGAPGVRTRLAALVSAGLIETPESGERRSALAQSLNLAPPLIRFLLGVPLSPPATECCGSGGAQPRLEPVVARGETPAGPGELIVCRADDAERQAAWASRLLAKRGRNGLHLPADALDGAHPVMLPARLANAIPVLHEPAFTNRDPAANSQLAASLLRLTESGISILWLVPAGWQAGPAFSQIALSVVDLAPANQEQRAADWAKAILDARLALAPERAEALAATLAQRFSLAGSRITLAVRSAQALLDAEPEIADCSEALDRSARQIAARMLSQVARQATKPHRWPQLVLPPTTLQLLREVASAVVTREQVFRDWNMQGRTGRSSGLMLLFAGASGTGKTMAASVIANQVGLELFRIDLAGVVSKYIGETEKNLDRIFSAAHDADAILLFDEADALLGKRAEVKDAHDRYANIEVAYLLQKMEEHDGVVILASNLPKNLDQAFSRRMHYIVEFSRPNAILRDQLWRGMFPAEVPLAADIDYAFLAEQFDLTGGDIQTIALEAAFLAAGEGKPVGMAQLMRAIARRQTKHGDPGVAARFRVYLDTLEQGRA